MSSSRDRLGLLAIAIGSIFAGTLVANLAACIDCSCGSLPEPADRSFIVDEAEQEDTPTSDLLGARVDTFADGSMHIHYTSATGFDWTARFRPIVEGEEPRPGCD